MITPRMFMSNVCNLYVQCLTFFVQCVNSYFNKYLTNIGHGHILRNTTMNTHRIHRVAKLTGLSRDVIRVWERRFGLLKPTRGANRYRNYSDEDVALLRYLKQQLDAGASIGDLAKLGREELIARLRAEAPRMTRIANIWSCATRGTAKLSAPTASCRRKTHVRSVITPRMSSI